MFIVKLKCHKEYYNSFDYVDSHTTTMYMLYLIIFCAKYNNGYHVTNAMMQSETSSLGVLHFFHPSCYTQVMIFLIRLLCITNQLDFFPMAIHDKQGISLSCPLPYNMWEKYVLQKDHCHEIIYMVTTQEYLVMIEISVNFAYALHSYLL
jgi:hypothetical protein